MSNLPTTRIDHYASITASIVAQLEQGVRPWQQPWDTQHLVGTITRPLRHNGQPYHGINVIVLWLTAFERGYTSPIWMTFSQALELGGAVRKGERGTRIVYANSIERLATDDAGAEVTERIPFLKSYTVFNSEQIDGLASSFYSQPVSPLSDQQRIERVDAYFQATNIIIRHGGNRAYYSTRDDAIQMPLFESFRSYEHYSATLAHESIHATRHERRLNRSFDSKRFGDDGYAMEELVAELGAAFVCADLGLTPEIMPDHASYLDSWLRVLRADTKAIFTAAAYAERAAEFLGSLAGASEP